MAATHSLSLVSASSQYATINDASSPNIDITGSQTWECWFYNTTLSSNLHLGGIRASGGGSLKGFYTTSTQVVFVLSGLTTTDTVTASPTLTTGVWNHVAGVYNSSNSTLKIYLNGEETGSVTASGTTSTITAGFSIGRFGDQASSYFNGRIRNFRIWNVARTQQEIRDNMNIDTPVGTGLQGNWILNNDYTDSSANGYTLTASGSPVFSTTYPDAINLTENNAFLAKHKISIDHTKVAGSSNFTDFPVVFTESNFLPAVFTNTQGQEINTNALKSDSSLKAYYRMESGALTTDSSGNGFTLTNNNTVGEGTGIFGGACDFGTGNNNKYLSINNDLGITNGACTLSIWIKNNAEITTDRYRYLEKSDAGTNVSYYIEYDYNAGSIRLAFARAKLGVVADQVNYTITLGTSAFYHLVLSYNATTVRGYVNGVLVGTIASSGNGTSGGVDITTIGTQRGADGRWSNALIDDVAIFDRALSTEEVRSLYAGGQDLRFSTDINGKTRLAHEVVSWDIVNKTGEVWVKINELDYDDNTNLYVHYKNATAQALDENEAFGKHQVYPSAYKAVWHLSNTTESTLSSNDGTATSVTFNSSNGKIKEGGEFNGTTSVITHGITNLPTGSTARTMAAWVNLSAQPTTNSQMYILNYGTQTTNNASILIYSDVSGTKKLVFAGFANDGNVNATLSNSIWYHVLITYSSTTVTFYLDGSSIGTASISTLNTGTTGGAIGRPFWTTSSFFNGKIDNAFITNTALSADYIKTLYDNQNSPATFARPVKAGGAFLLQFV